MKWCIIFVQPQTIPTLFEKIEFHRNSQKKAGLKPASFLHRGDGGIGQRPSQTRKAARSQHRPAPTELGFLHPRPHMNLRFLTALHTKSPQNEVLRACVGSAEMEGFEPPVPARVHRISSAAHSTTLAHLRFKFKRFFHLPNIP